MADKRFSSFAELSMHFINERVEADRAKLAAKEQRRQEAEADQRRIVMEAKERHQRDIEAAQRLSRSRGLKKPKVGPRIARMS